MLTLWDHYYVFVYGSIRELTASQTLVTKPFRLLYRDVLPERNRECYSMSTPLMFNFHLTTEGAEGERALLQHRQLNNLNYSVNCYLPAALCLPFYATLCITRLSIGRWSPPPRAISVNYDRFCW